MPPGAVVGIVAGSLVGVMLLIGTGIGIAYAVDRNANQDDESVMAAIGGPITLSREFQPLAADHMQL